MKIKFNYLVCQGCALSLVTVYLTSLLTAVCAFAQENTISKSDILHGGLTKTDVSRILADLESEPEIKRIELDNGNRWIYFGPSREMAVIWFALVAPAGGAFKVGTLSFLDLEFDDMGILKDVKQDRDVSLTITGKKPGHGIRIIDTFAQDIGGTMTVYFPSRESVDPGHIQASASDDGCLIYVFGSGGSVLGVPITASLDNGPSVPLATKFFYTYFDTDAGDHQVKMSNYRYGDASEGESTIEVQCVAGQPAFIEYTIGGLFSKARTRQIDVDKAKASLAKRLPIGGAYSFY